MMNDALMQMKSRLNNTKHRRAMFLPALLRTAILFGALAFVNISAQAQTLAQREQMPDAFETRDPVTRMNDMLDNNQYYYIQFYGGDGDRMFLAEMVDGEERILRTKDYIPFAKNMQWTLVSVPDGKRVSGVERQFYLKSANDYYVYLDGSQYKCTSDINNATPLTSYSRPDGGYEIGTAANTTKTMQRRKADGSDLAIWTAIDDLAHKYANKDNNHPRGSLRIAKLKENIAHIIYYQDPVYDSSNRPITGNEPGRANTLGFGQRHYLTFSGTDPDNYASAAGKSVITNGSFESDDVTCYFSPNSSTHSSITEGVGKDGSRGIVVTSGENQDFDWRTQFIIQVNTMDPISEGSVIHVEFDYKADKDNVSVPTQAQGYSGNYHHWTALGENVNFTKDWQHFSKNIVVTNDMVTGEDNDGFRSIAFCLARPTGGDNPVAYAGQAVTYYFDNIVFVDAGTGQSDVSSRSSIMKTYDYWAIPTIASYHKDGLWTLEGTGVDGEFYIKKYGDDNNYLKVNQIDTYNFCTVLGAKDDVYGKFNPEDSYANRYTRIHNNTSTAIWGLSRYISSKGDGWPVIQGPYNGNDYWQAGFWPVEVPAQDEFYRVLLGVKRERRTDNRIRLTRETNSQGNPAVSSTDNLYSATFTPDVQYTNLFQIRNLPVGCYQGLVIEFDGAITAGWGISGIVSNGSTGTGSNRHQGWIEMTPGITSYTMDLTGFTYIEDLTIFNVGGANINTPLTINACYFTPTGAESDCGITEMLNYNGLTSPYSEDAINRILWELEQVDDYGHFRLKTPDGYYYQDVGKMTGDPSQAAIFTNETLFEYFDVKWFYVDPNEVSKVIDVSDRVVKHKQSYLREYATDSGESQGLIRDADSDWMKNGTQQVNEFKITHYVKRGNTRQMILPTTLRENNDHVFYQRWYIKGDEENLTRLQERVSLNVTGGHDVAYYIYKNGLVTGQKLQWPVYGSNVDKCVQYRFSYTNPDGAEEEVPITADVSRYSDFQYEGTGPSDGDLIEPSLTMRYIYYMNDAKSMARRLMYFTEGHGWKENKPIRFPVKRLSYENDKNPAYQGEFLSLRHLFRDYWVFDDPKFIKEYVFDEQNKEYVGVIDYDYIRNKSEYNAEITTKYGEVTQTTMDKFLDDHLVSSVIYNDQGKESGKRIMITWGNNDANLSLGGHKENNVAQGFYLYDEVYNKYQYGDSRFMVFNYPGDQVTIPDGETEVSSELVAYFVDDRNTPDDDSDDIKYQLCRYTIIFEKLSDPTNDNQTKPWSQIKGTNRDPNKLRDIAGPPIAKVTFDYPDRSTGSDTDKNFYHTPQTGNTKHNNNPNLGPGSQIDKSSPIPLPFDKTNYAFDGADCSWGSYALISESGTPYGYNNTVYPSNTSQKAGEAVLGYAIEPDEGMQDGFMYIDASEMPGDICSVSFQGDFCADDKLMCTGWISGANKKNWESTDRDKRCPGGITLTMKGEYEDGSTETIYRFCPGQCYEVTSQSGAYVEWQQFYFEFSTDKKYKRYWMEVNNNCISSNGGDFMLDNIEVYAIVPEVKPDVNTPLCISVAEDGETVTDMRLLKLRINYNKLKSSRNVGADGTAEEGFVFLAKNKFLETFKAGLATLSLAEKQALHLDFDFVNISLDELADAIEKGDLAFINMSSLPEDNKAYIAYKNAFDAAILGEKTTWHSDDPWNKLKSSIMYFRWDSDYTKMQPFSFTDAVNKKNSVFYEEDADGEKWVVMNGNFSGLNWKTNTDYYVINTNQTFSSMKPFTAFNLCSECTKFTEFRIEPPLEVLGLDAAENMEDLVVCDGQIPTLLTNLKGYDINGKEVKMKNLNFDWWLGKKGDTSTDPATPPVLATLDNYHNQYKLIDEDGEDVKENRIYLAYALSTMRAYYPGITSLDGITKHEDDTPYLKDYMIKYLQEVVDAGELLLHQTTISVPAEKVLESDPYFYLVACPIHDEMFNQALNPSANEYVAFYCDEPQGVRIKLGQKAPRLQTGFVSGEHGFTKYNYNFPANTNPVLSIRLAKAAQFETVKNDADEVSVTNSETEEVTYSLSDEVNYLWLPIRNAETEGAPGVIKKSKDDNIYLASSNDLTWDKKISAEMNKNGSLPIVGRIVQLTAVNTKNNSSADENGNNRLCVYFTKDFNVREGYNYTLSLPFQEDDNSNACDGTILINLKIVPDYEVWTGAAGNIDWNNDENWRRADGNTGENLIYDVYGDELYRAHGAVGNKNSPLYEYTTNKDNYYSSATSKKKPSQNPKPSSDQILRKGFAPLYCTHVLMKNDEWGNAPELYDGLDVKTTTNNNKLKDEPFPNLRETSTPILKFDMQARRYDMWEETYGVPSDRGVSTRPNDLIAEMYQINSCDEIAFQPGTELRNAHLLNYNTAWVEYQLDNKRWYLLGSPLQGTISGEWYAPTGTAKQKTTYYDPVSFRPRYIKVANPKATDNPSTRGWYKKSGDNYALADEITVVSGTEYYYLTDPCEYDRYSPAIYQRSWDKAKAVLYEVGSTYNTTDDSQTGNLGNDDEGIWSSGSWNVEGGGTADEYLDRLGYKPMGGNKANVAIKGIWSNTYNDAQVDYATGGFSVMVMNHLKNNDQSGEVVDQNTNEKRYSAIIRLPKEDTMYDYYEFSQNNENDGGTDTELSDVRGKGRAKNRGRLKADKLLPEPVDGMTNYTTPRTTEENVSIYGDQRTYTRVPTLQGKLQEMNGANFTFTETIPAGATSTLNFYLVENPFPCGLDMAEFFTANKDVLEAKYWLLTANGQQLVQKADDSNEWISPEDEAKVYYPNPENIGTTSTFYPHAVVAPGQGFFVQAKENFSGDLTVTFNRGMQAQSRFGAIEGEGKTYTIVVGQAQVMQKMYDSTGDGLPDALFLYDSDDDGAPDKIPADLISAQKTWIETGNDETPYRLITANDTDSETIWIDTDADNIPDAERNILSVLVYEEIDDPDNPGETIKIPKLKDIEEDVVIYKYVPETLKLANNSTIDKEYPLLSRQTRGGKASNQHGLVITAKRGADESNALVMKRDNASDDFLPSEDTEVFINSDLVNVPTVYTLCGRLATTINSIHDFTCLPLGVESSSEAPCVLTFNGVEQLGDSVAFYDAVERKLTPLESGMKFTVSGQTQNRYYLVKTLIQEEAAEETHLQIFTEGRTVKVIASTAEPITNVRCFDTSGRLVHSASPQSMEYSFALPKADIYIIEAQTEKDRKTKKVMAK